MGQKITTTTLTLSHNVAVSYICEHCGTYNVFTEVISGEKSTGRDKLTLSQTAKITNKAQEKLDGKLESAKSEVERGSYSWVQAKKCSKCKYYQSWQTARIWKDFLVSVFVVPPLIILFVVLNYAVFKKIMEPFLKWIVYITAGVIAILILVSIINLPITLFKRDRKNHNIPTIVF